MSKPWFIYSWGNNDKRRILKGRRCQIVNAMKMNSVLVRFENGEQEVISRRALRKKRP